MIKDKGKLLKNYCKGTNKVGDIFWLMMDRNSDSFDSGIGKIKYENATEKFEKYEAAKCLYAITFFQEEKRISLKRNASLVNKNTTI